METDYAIVGSTYTSFWANLIKSISFYDLQEITTPATIEFNSRYADNDSTDLIVSR